MITSVECKTKSMDGAGGRGVVAGRGREVQKGDGAMWKCVALVPGMGRCDTGDLPNPGFEFQVVPCV